MNTINRSRTTYSSLTPRDSRALISFLSFHCKHSLAAKSILDNILRAHRAVHQPEGDECQNTIRNRQHPQHDDAVPHFDIVDASVVQDLLPGDVDAIARVIVLETQSVRGVAAAAFERHSP